MGNRYYSEQNNERKIMSDEIKKSNEKITFCKIDPARMNQWSPENLRGRTPGYGCHD